MGITQLSLDRINRYIKLNSKVLILGCQNLFDNEHYGQVAHGYFESLGHDVVSIDITGCQGSDISDLREDLKFQPIYDLVIECGSKEHIDGSLYQPMLNIHNALKIGGIAIHENPKTGNWPGHGYHYFTPEFFESIGYDIIEVGEEPAMGNETDGWNIYAVLRKNKDEFMDEEQFNEIYERFVFPK